MQYADDFIILINGKIDFANWLKNKFEIWLKLKLKLKLSEIKTIRTNLKTKAAKFLVFSLKIYIQ